MLDVEGLSPLITPSAEFYRIDTALQVPTVDPATWRLRVTGMVENEIELSFEDLLALPRVEVRATDSAGEAQSQMPVPWCRTAPRGGTPSRSR